MDTSQSAADCTNAVDAFIIHSPDDEQIGWIASAPVTSTNPNAWTTGRGYLPYSYIYANDKCTSPALNPSDASLQETVFTCASPYRLQLWLDDYQVPANYGSNTPHHWFPPTAPAAMWSFIAATP